MVRLGGRVFAENVAKTHSTQQYLLTADQLVQPGQMSYY